MSINSVLTQVVEMFLLMGVGFGAFRGGMFSEKTTKEMTSFLMNIVSPCVIVFSFCIPFSPALAKGLWEAALAAAAAHVLGIAAARLVFNNRWPETYRRVLRFAAAYANCGFMGLPLLQSVVGGKSVIYGSVYIAVFNIFCWTHGVSLYKTDAEKEAGLRERTRFFLKSALNPNVIAIGVGLAVFLIPAAFGGKTFGGEAWLAVAGAGRALTGAMGYISSLNTPLSMVVIGTQIAGMELKTLFTEKFVWPGVFMRNLAIPGMMLLLCRAAGLTGLPLSATLVMTACPVAGNTVLFARLFDRDVEFPSRLMTVSTLCSLATLPLWLWAGSLR